MTDQPPLGEARKAWEKRYRQRVARFNDTPELVEFGVRTHPMPPAYADGWQDGEAAARADVIREVEEKLAMHDLCGGDCVADVLMDDVRSVLRSLSGDKNE